MLVPEQPSTHSFSCLSFTATLSPVFCTEVRPIGIALPARRTVIGRHCSSVETAQPGDRTTNPDAYASSQRVDSLARVVITPVRHTHTRLQDDTARQTQDSKFEPWRSEAEHATSRSQRLPTLLSFTSGWDSF